MCETISRRNCNRSRVKKLFMTFCRSFSRPIINSSWLASQITYKRPNNRTVHLRPSFKPSRSKQKYAFNKPPRQSTRSANKCSYRKLQGFASTARQSLRNYEQRLKRFSKAIKLYSSNDSNC